MPDSCRGDDPDPPRWHASVSGGWLASELHFDDGARVDLRETTIAAGLGYRLTPRWTIQLGLGALVDGGLGKATGARSSLQPGVLASASAVHVFVDGRDGLPFVTAALTAGVLRAHADFTALDVKLSASAGKTFGRFSPYLGGALFGGPVFRRHGGMDTTGTDDHHFQLLGGLSVALPGRVDLFAEASPLGERSISGGAGIGF